MEPDSIKRSDLTKTTVLGRGGFGCVYKGLWHSAVCAIKEIAITDKVRLSEDDLMKEARVQSTLRHPNVVTCYGISIESDNIWIVMALIEGSNLAVAISEKKIKPEEKVTIATQICDAIRYLHDDKRIVHNDLKRQNVMVQRFQDNYIMAYLTDFGISRYIGIDYPEYLRRFTNQPCGTLWYMAPECLRKGRVGKGYLKPTFESDIWSLGALLVELFSEKDIYKDWDEFSFKAMGLMPESFKGVPRAAQNIVQKCLSKIPEERPAAKELLSFISQNTELKNEMKQKQLICDEAIAEENVKKDKDTKPANKNAVKEQNAKKISLLPSTSLESDKEEQLLEPDLIPRDEIERGRLIGKGGEIFKGFWIGMQCAIKTIKIPAFCLTNKDMLVKEAKMLSSLRHPNIVPCFGISYEGYDLWMIMELINGKDLYELMSDEHPKLESDEAKITLCLQICDAIRYLHDDKLFIHNNIKSENILVQFQNDTPRAYLSGFGIARYLGNDRFYDLFKDKSITYYPNEILYMAPELLEKKGKDYEKPSFASDIWSLGLLLTEIFLQDVLFDDFKKYLEYCCRIKKQLPTYFENLPDFVQDILRRCLDLESCKRPSAKELTLFFKDCFKKLEQ